MTTPRPFAFARAARRPVRLSLGDLVRLHGAGSPAVMLMVLALLSAIPGAGLGTVLSLAILLLAWRWPAPLGAGGALARRLDGLRLDETWSRRCLHSLAWLYSVAGRVLRERGGWAWHGRVAPWWGPWIGLMGLLILLPIPLGNVLPCLSLVLLSLGWMFRDGVALALSSVVGAAALGFAWAVAAWLVATGQSLV